MAHRMDAIQHTPLAPPKLSWLKRIVRYGIHLIVLYQVVSFSTTTLPDLLYKAILWATHRTGPSLPQAAGLLFSHLPAFSMIPAFAVGLVINAKFRHKTAEYIWIVPVVILAFEFIFHGPGIYPTMLGDSDFPKAFHFFFVAGSRTGFPVGEFHPICRNNVTICSGLYFFMGIPASPQNEFSLTPAGTKTPARVSCG